MCAPGTGLGRTEVGRGNPGLGGAEVGRWAEEAALGGVAGAAIRGETRGRGAGGPALEDRLDGDGPRRVAHP
jgi:hypothetical protein